MGLKGNSIGFVILKIMGLMAEISFLFAGTISTRTQAFSLEVSCESHSDAQEESPPLGLCFSTVHISRKRVEAPARMLLNVDRRVTAKISRPQSGVPATHHSLPPPPSFVARRSSISRRLMNARLETQLVEIRLRKFCT